MLSYQEAYRLVLQHSCSWGVEEVPLADAVGRVLAEDILADRDFPPFNRATKDGFAFKHSSQNNNTALEVEDIAPAGKPQKVLQNPTACIEIMTGAVLPVGCDTVVMYEDVTAQNNKILMQTVPERGSNIHMRGADNKKGDKLLSAPVGITAAEIGILASVGMDKVLVKSLPKVGVITTGDELVEVTALPQLHQIRKSNGHTLIALLRQENISAELLHLPDDAEKIEELMSNVWNRFDAIILSGGVSKGKFDYLPQYFEKQRVEKIFHFVKQQPGKPFWFGVHSRTRCMVFALPGNPVSTFVNYHLYFFPWLKNGLGLANNEVYAQLKGTVKPSATLTKFIKVKIFEVEGATFAQPIADNGSGDLTGLSRTDGFLQIEPGDKTLTDGALCRLISTRNRRI